MRKIRKILPALILLALVAGIIGYCASSKYPRPTREFYVNDFADALLPGTREVIITEGELLFERTENETDGGAQIVVATLLAESEEDAEAIDRTELFRSWKIGKNDMGILVLLIFVDEGEDRVLVSPQIEIGYRMEQYLTAARAGSLIDDCLYNPEWDESLDMGVGELYYELLGTVYTQAYGYDVFEYDMEDYREGLLYTYEDVPQVPMSLWIYLLSPFSSLSTKLFAGFFVLLLGGGGGLGGFLFRRNRGGGGSSGGYGAGRFFRK